jgi:hypothetical protein
VFYLTKQGASSFKYQHLNILKQEFELVQKFLIDWLVFKGFITLHVHGVFFFQNINAINPFKYISTMKVFRKIRRKLMVSGKVKSCLLYAFGEIILIVIGILIAWKINNLNEIRKNKIVQVKIYESLYEELNTNLNVIDKTIVGYSNTILSLQNSLNYVGQHPNKLTQEARDLIVQIKFKTTNLRDKFLNSVNITDKFQFLENDSLAVLISQYPSELKTFETQEAKINNIVENRLKPIIEKHVSLIDLLPNGNENYINIKLFGQQSNYIQLLNSKDYQNSVIDQLMQTQVQLNNGIDLRKKTRILAFKLSRELGN